MDSLQDIEWPDLPLVEARPSPELNKWMKDNAPSALPHVDYLSDCAWIAHADVYLDEPYTHINDIAQLIYLTVSRDSSCRFCYGASRFLLRLSGLSEPEIERLERDLDTAETDPATRLALDYARRVSRSNPAPNEDDKQALRDAGFNEDAIREIAFQATDVVFHNRMGTLLALPIDFDKTLNDKNLFAAMRENFSALFSHIAIPAKAERLADNLKTGPYSSVVIALDGLHQARQLRTIIDEAWGSPHLPTRTKVLIFAVIARGLGSQSAEEESYRLLAAEGLSADQVDTILAHLSGPELDEAESCILPYVRETIWYQAPIAQKRGRELRSRLTNEQFLETVGIAALANMVCRLPLVLDVN